MEFKECKFGEEADFIEWAGDQASTHVFADKNGDLWLGTDGTRQRNTPIDRGDVLLILGTEHAVMSFEAFDNMSKMLSLPLDLVEMSPQLKEAAKKFGEANELLEKIFEGIETDLFNARKMSNG